MLFPSRACAHVLLLGSSFVSLAAPSAVAAIVNLAPVKDSVIFSESNNTNGGGEVLHVGTNGSGGIRRGMLQFDIAGNIPAGSTITGATLTLHLNDTGSGSGDRTVALHRILASWGDGTTGSGGASGGSGQGFPPANGDVTWNYRFYSTTPPTPPLAAWSTAGGDFLSSPSAALTFVPVIGDYYTWSGAGLIGDLQAWLDNPLQDFGWMLRGVESGAGTLVKFDALERTVAEFRPVLTVEYSPVPEPSTFLLLVCGTVGWMAAACRRRPVLRRGTFVQ